MADYSDERSLRRFAAFTPDEKAGIMAYERDPARLQELDDEIARTTDPARRRVLEEYRASTFGDAEPTAPQSGIAGFLDRAEGGAARPARRVNFDSFLSHLENQPAPKAPERRTVAGTAKDVGLSLLKGAVAVPEAAIGLADMVTGGAAGRGAEAIGIRTREAQQILDDSMSVPQKEANQRFEQAQGFAGKLGAAIENPSIVGHAVVQSLPSMGAGAVVARGVRAVAPRIGAGGAGAVGEGVVAGGSAAEQIRQETGDGALTGEQARLAGATGVATAAFGALGARVARALGIGDVDTMLVAAARDKGIEKNVVRRVLEGAFTEGVLEELPQSVSEQVLQNVALNRPIDQGVDAAAVLGLLSGAAMGASVNALPSGGRPAQPQQPGVERPNPSAAQPNGAPLPGLTAGQEADALSAIERQGKDDLDAIRQQGRMDRTGFAPMPGVDPNTGSAQFIESPEMDRLLTLKEQLADEGVRNMIRDRFGAEALGQAMHYAEIADRPDIDLPEKTRERMLGMAEQIVSRSILRPLGATPGAEVQPQIGAAPAVPQITLDTTPTGVMRADVAGNVTPETRADVISDRQAREQDPFAPQRARIQSLRDAGEDEAADVLQERLGRMETARATDGELADMAAAAPKQGLFQLEPFQREYRAARVAGKKPVESAARAGMAFAMRALANQIGMSEKLLNPVLEKAAEKAVADIPAMFQRYLLALTNKGAIERKEGLMAVARQLADLRDQVMLDAQGIYDRRATLHMGGNVATSNPPTRNPANGTESPQAQPRAPQPAAPAPTASIRPAQPATAPAVAGVPQEREPARAPVAAIDEAAHEAATSPLNDRPEPTDAQKEAGNYKVGRVRISGLDISIENPKGSVRRGKRPDGTEWAHTMSDHYGYIRRTEGADGDHVDTYIGPNPDSQKVYIVDQIDQRTGRFDEHKVMLGFDTQEAAQRAYRSNFDKGWKMGPVRRMGMDQFKAWLRDGDTTKPVAETGTNGNERERTGTNGNERERTGEKREPSGSPYHPQRAPFPP